MCCLGSPVSSAHFSIIASRFSRMIVDLPRAARIDHLPALLRQLANRLDKNADIND